MTDLRLVLEPGSLELSARGAVTGRLFFRFGSGAFPDPAWNDFVVVVLAWWVEALAKLHAAGEREAELLFMDGPFSVRLLRTAGDSLDAELVRRSRSRDRIVGRATVQLPVLVQDVAEAATIVLRFSVQRAASNADIQALRTALARAGL